MIDFEILLTRNKFYIVAIFLDKEFRACEPLEGTDYQQYWDISRRKLESILKYVNLTSCNYQVSDELTLVH